MPADDRCVWPAWRFARRCISGGSRRFFAGAGIPLCVGTDADVTKEETMRKMVSVVLVVLVCVLWCAAGYAQDGGGPCMYGSMEQTEMAMGEGVDAEMRSTEAENQSAVARMEESMDTGGEVQ